MSSLFVIRSSHPTKNVCCKYETEEFELELKKYLGTVIEKTPNQYVWHYYLAEAEAEVDNTGINV